MALRATLLSALIGCLAVAGSPAVARAPGRQGMTLTSRGESVIATQGSYCGPAAQAGANLCADYGYPLRVSCKLPVKRGGRVAIRTETPATALTASLIGPDPQAPGKRLRKAPGGGGGADGMRWKFKLPSRTRDYAAIDAFARYTTGGDSDTWTGLATGACRGSDFSKP
ncbi:MAG: hypothetical protein ABR536_05140 [Solirubrobacterales bacterium]